MADIKQKIVPSLWFDTGAEEAMNFYVEVFNGAPNKRQTSKIIRIDRYPEGIEELEKVQPGMAGKVINGEFELEGQKFICLDGGPLFRFNESVSFTVDCETQEEIDYYWGKLSAVPESEQCGWLKDKYGLSWQIIPRRLGELLTDKDKGRADRAMNAMLKMKKLDIAKLEEAAGK
jgi:predicted 3-demethylubiquinone-9 3-methyltransferase (glyoxalase superfamily)